MYCNGGVGGKCETVSDLSPAGKVDDRAERRAADSTQAHPHEQIRPTRLAAAPPLAAVAVLEFVLARSRILLARTLDSTADTFEPRTPSDISDTAMASQLTLAYEPVLAHSSDAWCLASTGDFWDGVDWDRCFRVKVFDGLLPLTYLQFTVPLLLLLAVRRAHASLARSKESYIRLAAEDEASTAVPSPIAQAEADVLRQVAEKQSPDWRNPATQHELLGLHADAADDRLLEEVTPTRGGFKVVLRAIWGTKKDLLNVAGASAMVAISTLKLVRAFQGLADGRVWVIAEVASWAWVLLLTVIKLALAFAHRLFALRHPDVPHRNLPLFYTTLEQHIIPYFVVYAAFTGFFDLRTAILDYQSFPYGPAREAVKIEAALFAISAILAVLEFFAPRPSQFSSRSSREGPPAGVDAKGEPLPPSPEMHASLASLATFSYMERFQLRSAFPRWFGIGPIKMNDIPDLRPDDKTARALLSYRQSLTTLDTVLARLPLRIRRRFVPNDEGVEALGLTWKLVYHFWPDLVAQNIWSLIRVAMNGIPPLMLKGILAHIGARQRGEDAPMHVAVLYAWVLFLATVVGSVGSSQALFIGRRICLRMRSIIVGDVFTKALRRKDQAGSSATHAKANVQSSVSPAPTVTVKAVPNAGEDEEAAAPGVEQGKEELEQIEEDLQKASSGKILNLISVDAYRLSEVCAYLHFLTSEMPLTIVVICFLLFQLLGWSALAGVGFLIAIMPIQTKLSKLYHKYQGELLAAADQRLELTTEVIGQLRIVKFFAWERRFIEMMETARKKELAAVWRRAVCVSVSGTLMFGTPVFVGVVTFVTHTKILHRPLTAETAFTALALFTVLRGPLEGFTDMLVNVIQAHVSLKRIDAYMHEEETHKYSILAEPSTSEDPIVGFVDGTFTWSDEEKARNDPAVFRILDLNLRFPEGQFSIVLGSVGSGKTTLLLSLLGETNRLSGSAYLPSPVVRTTDADPAILTETTAYAAQTPWLMSATIRDNIVFGAQHNEKRYRATLEACALLPDLKQFELGDETEVGEKGTVLSGGQKARISLARAIYSSAKYVLLDDVLSAVDSHTAQHLVEKCLTGSIMRHRTCVLVTHAVDLCLPYAGFVVTLDQGAVVSAGAPDTLSQSRILALEKEQDAHARAEEAQASASTIEAIAEGETDLAVLQHQEEERKKRIDALKLIKDETQAQGSVKGEVYLLYAKALGAWKFAIGAFIIFVGAQFSDIAVSLALRYWAASFDNKEESFRAVVVSTLHHSMRRWQSLPAHIGMYLHAGNGTLGSAGIIEGHETDSDYWLVAYCLLAVANLTLITGRVAYFSWGGIQASRRIYRQLIVRILQAPIRFFDSTPTGRILNRLSKDMETIDQELPSTALYLLLEILMIMGIIGTVSAALPSFLVAGVLISIFYWVLGKIYLASSRELKRYESVTRSPIFSVFGESLQGVATIRAYGDASRFMKQIFGLLDDNNRPFFTLWAVNRWLSFRVDTAAGAVSLIAALFVIFARKMDPALAGFVMSFAMAFADRALWTTRLWSQLEMQANSVERVQEYLELEQENQGGIKPPAIWPTRGATIEVKNLTAAYAPGLPDVLKDVSFTVKGGEKIGIVGRTGSGKSSLALSFFRFIEPRSGSITIDGLDINSLRLEDLRKRLTIVAQEAALFKGSLRFNLDPFAQHSDRDVWDALRRVQMAAPGVSGITPKPTPGQSRVASPTPGDEEGSEAETAAAEETERYVVKSLDMEVTEGGKNFSAGQRQLLALARGILKLQSSSILILDESTASLDHATDERIQQTIRAEMADATILCIAHRLRTVVDYTKILVLDQGRVVEFDTPSSLLAREDSAFTALCRKSGEFDLLKEMADEAAAELQAK
ncbi:Transporter of the ATP-binding cassette (ABC) [Rhodotorula kratochvilovae]